MAASIARDSCGIVGRYQYDDANVPWDANDWTVHDYGGGLSFSVDGSDRGVLTCTGGDAGYAINDTIGSRTKTLIYSWFSAVVGGSVSLHAHWQAFEEVVYLQSAFSSLSGEQFLLGESIAGVDTNIDFESMPGKSAGTYYEISLYADATDATGYDHDEDTTVAITLADYFSGKIGLGGSATTRFRYWIAMSDRNVTVNGLTSGYTVKVRDSGGSTIAETEATGASATVDLFEASFRGSSKPYDVAVFDGASLVASVNPTDTGEEGVWGGDVYTLTDDVATGSATLTVPLLVRIGPKGDYALTCPLYVSVGDVPIPGGHGRSCPLYVQIGE